MASQLTLEILDCQTGGNPAGLSFISPHL